MLTFLSHILGLVAQTGPVLGGQDLPKPPPRLRLAVVGHPSEEALSDRDSPIAIAQHGGGEDAPAFLAGVGARLYSLDAWRRAHGI
jgi:hypothetical protein